MISKIIKTKGDISIQYDGRFDDVKIIYCYNTDFNIYPKNNKSSEKIFKKRDYIVYDLNSNEYIGVIFIRYYYDIAVTPAIYDINSNKLFVWKEYFYYDFYDDFKFFISTDDNDLDSYDNIQRKTGDLICGYYEDRSFICGFSNKKRLFEGYYVDINFDSVKDVTNNEDGTCNFYDINSNYITIPTRKFIIKDNLSNYFNLIIEYISFCNEKLSGNYFLLDNFKDINISLNDDIFTLYESFYEVNEFKMSYIMSSIIIRTKYLEYLLNNYRIDDAIKLCESIKNIDNFVVNFSKCFYLNTVKNKTFLDFYRKYYPKMLFKKKKLRLRLKK